MKRKLVSYAHGDAGTDSPFYEWFAESFRTIASRAVAAGFVKESEFNFDTPEEQLRQEAVSRNATIPSPTMVGCFARKSWNGHQPQEEARQESRARHRVVGNHKR